MDIPLLFGPYSSAALAHSDQLAPYDANAIGFICLTSARSRPSLRRRLMYSPQPWHIFLVTLLERCQLRRLHHD